MNETGYNMAMFGKEYLDKAIDGIQTVAPKVWWYLQWKCYITAIGWSVVAIVCIAYLIFFWIITRMPPKVGDCKKESTYKIWAYNTNGLSSVWVIVVLLGAVALLMGSAYEIVIAFTPICPLDKAIEIGTNLIG